jgi:monoterpene epsilon-lactone hydrolase
MTSNDVDALRLRYEENAALLAANPNLELPLMRALLEEIHRCAAEPRDVSYDEVVAGGRPALWCLPANAEPERVLLYFHGGGFVLQSMHSHRKLAGHLAHAAGARCLVLDYRQAPAHPFPAQLEDAVGAYHWLLDQGIRPENVVLAGDSAGANLAVATVLRLRELGDPQPAAVACLSPWFDMECDGPTLARNAGKDALVTRDLLAQMAALYLGPEGSATDSLANPLHADLSGFPPVYLCAGSDEALLDNGERFADRARSAGVDVTFDVVPGQQHVFVFMAGRAPAADSTIAAVAAWMAPKFGRATAPSVGV